MKNGSKARNFFNLISEQWKEGNFLCIGLDSDLAKIPKHLHYGSPAGIIFNFNKAIIDATAPYDACAFKPNRAFYDNVPGAQGYIALQRTIEYVRSNYPEIPIILDQKRDDIGNTNLQYVNQITSVHGLRADAVTVHPTFGQLGLKPFWEQVNKGMIVLCKTSNEGSGEFQNLRVELTLDEIEKLIGRRVERTERNKFGWATINYKHILVPLYQYIALRVSKAWNVNRNCALVVGATYPKELKLVRQLVGDGFPLLIPGIGAQGGDLEAVVDAGMDKNGKGVIINASSSIIYASSGTDFAEAAGAEARRLSEAIRAA